jgi:hypothetical protein
VKDYQTREIQLNSAMIEFLEAAAKQHGLPDIDKTVRCLVNYARENPDRAGDIFDEVRCLDC